MITDPLIITSIKKGGVDILSGEIEIVKALLDERPEELNIPSQDGFSLLGYACFFNQPAIARYLIVEKEADVTATRQPISGRR